MPETENAISPARPRWTQNLFRLKGMTTTEWLALAALFAFFAYHFASVWRTAVDLPYWDEWDADVYPPRSTLEYLFAAHNEHRIVTYKLVSLLLWYATGWNLRVQTIVNFLIYGAWVCLLWRFLRANLPKFSPTLAAVSMIWLLSPSNYENHRWAFQTQWHLMILCLLGMIHFLFRPNSGSRSKINLAAGIGLAILCMYSLSAGFAAVLVAGGLFAGYQYQLASKLPERRRSELGQLAIFAAIILPVALLYVVTRPLTPQATLTLPWQPAFWTYFLTIVGMSLTFASPTPWLPWAGVFVLAAMGFTIYSTLREAMEEKEATARGIFSVCTLGLSVLGSLLAISAGRAALGAEQAMASRYTEFTLVLLPIVLALQQNVFSKRQKFRPIANTAILLLFTIGLTTNWQFFHEYNRKMYAMNVAIKRLGIAYSLHAYADIPFLYHESIDPGRLRQAEEANLSFMSEVRKAAAK